jgi:hypothetical protein
MTSDRPTWEPFDPAGGPYPATLDLPDEMLGEGHIVALVATSEARAEGWAASAAASIARRWADDGGRVVLGDLDLLEPALHRVLGVPNGEGLTDGFLYGASIARIARRAPGGPYFFASAGTVVADPEEVLTHPRWTTVASGFAAAHANFVVFVPAEMPGARQVLERASHVVLMAGRREDPDAILGDLPSRVLAVIGPEASQAATAPPIDFPVVPPPGRDPLVRTGPPPSRRRHRWVWLALLVVLLALLTVGTINGIIPIPGLSQAPGLPDSIGFSHGSLPG